MGFQKLALYRTKSRVALRDLGVRHLIQRALEESLLRHIVLRRQFIIYAKQLADLDDFTLRNPHLQFRFLAASDSDVLRQIEEQSGFSQEAVSKMLAGGSECLVATDNGALAGYNLVSYGSADVHYLERQMPLSESEAWSDQIFASLPYRRSGVAGDLRQMMFRHLSKKGYTTLTGGYLPYNTRAGELARSLGFAEREKVILLKVLGWRRYFVRKLRPPGEGKHA